MSDSIWVGYVVFIAAPILLWVIVSALAKRGEPAKFLSLVSGHDGRLSLSRAQALAWTLVIFGSFCAAMSVHPSLRTRTDGDRKAAEQRYNDAVTAHKAAQQRSDQATAASTAAQQKATQAEENHKAATQKLNQAKESLAKTDPQKADLFAAAKKIVDDATKVDKDAADAEKTLADANAAATREKTAAENAEKTAEGKEREAKDAWRATKWVVIPVELLALAGISLAAGVFASVISASGDKGIDPVVTDISIVDPATRKPPSGIPNATRWLQITGTGFGDKEKKGSVRLNNIAARVLYWTDTDIGIDLPPRADYKRLTVDSPNGKLAHVLTKAAVANKAQSALELGERQVDYEWSDLVRDDESPMKLSLMKVQMFGWTIVALIFYVTIFLKNLGAAMDALPVVDATVVTLTGLSQSGYLAGKGASTMANK